MARPLPPELIGKAVKDFLTAQSSAEAKRIVEARSDLLLTDSADQFLAYLLELYSSDADTTNILRARRALLARCRRGGIEAAFADYQYHEMRALLNQIVQITNPIEMFHRAALCRTALQLVKSSGQPEEWAIFHVLLAESLAKDPRGERAENLEQAIFHYQQALQVVTRQASPEPWAEVQNNLGVIYRERIKGERAENLEQALRHLEQALQIRTRQGSPREWAETQNNLGNAYRERIKGERAENLEQALRHLEQALQIHTRSAYPEDWAKAQNNLGNVYLERIRGERAENLEQALRHLEQALKVYTYQSFPWEWALTHSNLGNIHVFRIRGERTDNLEQALHHYQQALQVCTRQAFPHDWAEIQHNLGNVYLERIRGERAENLEQALRHLEQALKVYTRRTNPERWALIQHRLGNIYSNRIRGERAENLEQAVLHYQQALQVSTPMTFPQESRDIAYALGYVLYNERRFSEAHHALTIAHQAIEALRSEVQRDIAKRHLARENADLYARLVFCCLQEGDESAAFGYTIAAKGRAFVDLLATTRFDLFAASSSDPVLAEDLRKVRELRQQIDNLLATLTGERSLSSTDSPKLIGSETSGGAPLPRGILRAQLRSLQAQEASHWDEMAYKYPALTATQKVPLLSVDQARTLAAELNTTLVEYYRHAEEWCAFVVTSDTMHYVPLPLITDELLQHMVTWMQRLEHPTGRNQLSYIRLSEWYTAVIAPLEEYLPQKRPVILAPFSILHVLPLAATRHPHTRRYIDEDYQIAFVPSLSALRTIWDQQRRTWKEKQAVLHRLLGVAYPGTPDSDHYLPNVLPEAEAIAEHFIQVTPLYQEKATPEAVLAQGRDQDVIHFGCHGWFDPEHPEQSGLMLAGGWLTVQRIISELHLEQARVATLAACLSGFASLQSGDELIGLLQAILSTGVQTVVASLWTADDAATRVLFETFYAHLVAGQTPAKALQEAARSVRAHPGWEHPYYWAAFQVSGLAHDGHEQVQKTLPS